MKRILDLKGAINLRELGGYKTTTGKQVKYKKLLRSGDISNLTPTTLDFLKDYGLKYVVDFRSMNEQKMWPDVESDFYKVYPDPVYPLKGNGEKLANILPQNYDSYLGMVYQTMVLDSHAQQSYSLLFQLLLKNDQPDQSVLFHCAAGKDRTGVGAILILKALQVDTETIVKDYLLTNLMYEDHATIDKILNDKHGNQTRNNMNMTKADIQSIESVFEAIKHYYGNFDNYLNNALGVDANDLKALRAIYLE
ncbi:tyrosine-protein phosphatase [Companilactobacillus sp.]|uniref:tyrosine-protein phosphatase n=2 Tax=Companilactobacillus sp. TaxID=2767905 RepID=UPI0025C6B9E6|nr:tyrosine-protein phosphatase [Companilactobacillus sp.]MCH4009016.1 tyrosine-protein phosphatase [Companilactobacillus sp.]MCH4050805.1 tyrosine-protein phosphatase [Companilactobacillus sp.]MCH4076958.1 tyrosine-protein phosphatase [Companilactobacillus sp.]MCH4125534.1 tyrosine-protein phosphatase [Companilactobacillus sp.]MCI1311243.1 tyrosine-protein phosphatase [Companilactobacillus sp.]